MRTGTAVESIETVDDFEGSSHTATTMHLGDGTAVPFGTLVWSAGLAQAREVVHGLAQAYDELRHPPPPTDEQREILAKLRGSGAPVGLS